MKRFRHWLLFLAVGMSLLLCIPDSVFAEETTDPAQILAEESGCTQMTEEMDWDIRSVLEKLGLTSISSDLSGETFTMQTMWDAVSAYLSQRIEAPFQMLAGIFSVILFAALLQSIENGSLQKNTSQVFEYLCAVAAVSVLASPLLQSFSAVETALSQGADFMTAFVPVFAGILAAGGTVGSAVCYQTAVIALADGVMQMICRVLLPFCTMSFALAIIDAVSPSVSVGGLLRLSRKITTWTLGLFMSGFLGVLSMQNFISGSVDTAASKTTRYVISNFVPVVGSAVSDAYTTVRGSLQILRSTTGVIGILSLALLFLPPLVQLLLYRGVVALGTAAAELFGTKRLHRLLQGTQQALAIAFALLVCFGVLFVIATAIAMTIGKGAV
ncbi:stage III sporulation protein AE [uncultured Ruminococcus sp.]|uniref:stage III sporulation protein AE n=1 Tax=uncultured Ruminococcus sp. TaxID=165186 RepID=UPI0025E13BB1|nr:stage III sporulation protein AE [uncultured Ruminococcus sp.]